MSAIIQAYTQYEQAMIETMLSTFRINDAVKVTYRQQDKVRYGVVKGFNNDISLRVEMIDTVTLTWVPCNNPNVLIEVVGRQ